MINVKSPAYIFKKYLFKFGRGNIKNNHNLTKLILNSIYYNLHYVYCL